MIMERGRENGLKNLRIIDGREIREIERFIAGEKAIRVERTGIIDYPQMTKRLGELMLSANPLNQICYQEEVMDISRNAGVIEIKTSKSSYQTSALIGCGGLQSDRLSKLDGLDPSIRIVPFRGDYYELAEAAWHKVKHLVYPSAGSQLSISWSPLHPDDRRGSGMRTECGIQFC